MARTFCKVTIIGTICRDIELRHVGANNTPVCTLGMVVNDRYKKGEEWVDEPCFFDVTCWSRHAEIVTQYCSKGQQLFVEGKLKQEKWEKDGQRHSKLVIVAREILLLGGKKEGQYPADRQPPDQQPSRPDSVPSQQTYQESLSESDDGSGIPF